jgi:hypothetical protein
MPIDERGVVPFWEHGAREHGRRDHGRRDHGRRDHGRRDHGRRDHGRRDHGRRDHGRRDHGQRDHGAREHGAREHGAREHGAREPREVGARRNGREQRASRGKHYATNTRAVLFAATHQRAVDGMFKIVYICLAPVLGMSVPKAFPKHGLGKFLAQKNILSGRSQTQIPKFGKDCFGIGCGGKRFLAQILNFGIWDLGQFFCAAVEMHSASKHDPRDAPLVSSVV